MVNKYIYKVDIYKDNKKNTIIFLYNSNNYKNETIFFYFKKYTTTGTLCSMFVTFM